MRSGIQVSSLKPLLLTEAQTRLAFEKMRALGCDVVQLQWIDPSVPIPAIARILEETGMESVSVQDFYETVIQNPDYYIGLNAATGGKWLCVSRIPERCKSKEGLDVYIGELRAIQKRLDPLGQQVSFHPVTPDYTAVPGMDAVAYLADNMPELNFCLDLFHLNRNCGDMPGYIRRLSGRVSMVHFKESKNGKLCPAGQGDIHWDGVVAACMEAGVDYGFVEQETWDRDPYDCLKEAMDWLDAQMK